MSSVRVQPYTDKAMLLSCNSQNEVKTQTPMYAIYTRSASPLHHTGEQKAFLQENVKHLQQAAKLIYAVYKRPPRDPWHKMAMPEL
jgi:hypothetical protein